MHSSWIIVSISDPLFASLAASKTHNPLDMLTWPVSITVILDFNDWSSEAIDADLKVPLNFEDKWIEIIEL